MINEGGAVEIDGHGTLIACKSSILNSNRNPEMTQEQAETMLGQSDVAVARYVEQQEQAQADKVEGWANEVRNDKEIGGDNLDESLSLAKGVAVTTAPVVFESAEFAVQT